MKLTNAQKTIIDDTARFKVAACGRRFGKTFASIAAMAKIGRFPNKKILYVAPSYRMAKQIVWDDLKQMLTQRKWVKRINESELTITLINSSQIFLRSADNPDSIRGIGVDFVVIDEAADIPDLEGTWNAVIRPTLSDREGGALIIGSPKGRDFFYDMYEHAKTSENWQCWQYTTADGGNVSEAELAQARQDLDERTYAQEYLSEFVTITNIIYYAFSDLNIESLPDPDPRTPLHIGMDFNVDPGCAVIAIQNKEGNFHVFDEIEIYGTNTYEMISEIERRYPGRKKFVYPDASGSQRRTSSNGITDHILLKNAGYQLCVGSINPAVADRIAAVNSAFKTVSGKIRLTIDPKCRKLLECIRKHTYKEGTRVPAKDTGWDHFNDALGYLVNYKMPIKQQIQSMPGQIRRSTGSYIT
jgi:hypothetical protein